MRDSLGRFLKGTIDTRTQETFDKIGSARRGKKHSLETKIKMSKSHKGQIPWNKGKKFPEFSGENHFHWRGGKDRFPKCIDCGKMVSSIYNTRCRHCLDKYKVGEKSNNWQGGLTALHTCIRHSSEMEKWRKKVFERDNFTCQECGKIGCYLEAHHKKSFSIIFKKFLKEYDQFSPIEDKETLIRLAMKWKLFWNFDNGITLCKDCHKNTNNYSNKNKKFSIEHRKKISFALRHRT